MRMAHHPVVEVGHPLNHGQGHHGALDAHEKIHDGSRENELGAHIRMDLSQFSLGRVPDVDEKDHDRDDHGHAVHNGNHLEPGGNRHLEKMMGADVGIHDDERPKPEKGEGMAVQRASGRLWV